MRIYAGDVVTGFVPQNPIVVTAISPDPSYPGFLLGTTSHDITISSDVGGLSGAQAVYWISEFESFGNSCSFFVTSDYQIRLGTNGLRFAVDANAINGAFYVVRAADTFATGIFTEAFDHSGSGITLITGPWRKTITGKANIIHPGTSPAVALLFDTHPSCTSPAVDFVLDTPIRNDHTAPVVDCVLDPPTKSAVTTAAFTQAVTGFNAGSKLPYTTWPGFGPNRNQRKAPAQSGLVGVVVTSTVDQTGVANIITPPGRQSFTLWPGKGPGPTARFRPSMGGPIGPLLTTSQTQTGIARIDGPGYPTPSQWPGAGPFRLGRFVPPIRGNIGPLLATPRTQTGIARIDAQGRVTYAAWPGGGPNRRDRFVPAPAPTFIFQGIQTQTAIARIQIPNKALMLGRGNIAILTPRTQTGVCRVTATTVRTQTAVSRVTASTSRTQTGVAQVAASTLRTQTGVGRITVPSAGSGGPGGGSGNLRPLSDRPSPIEFVINTNEEAMLITLFGELD